MKPLKNAIPALVLGGLVFLGACGVDEPPTALVGPPVETPQLQTEPVRVETPGGEAGLSRILVDASRDGGAWWFPQVAPFSGTSYHQGRALADSLRAAGYVVDELPRPFTITSQLLRSYELVIRASGFGTYGAGETSAYREYVEGGGKLLLLGDHMLYLPSDQLAASLGIGFAGITRGENTLSTFAAHPITADVSPLTYMVGAGIVSQPPSAQIVGRLSESSYLDVNKNGTRDSTDISAPAVLGVMSFGQGRIVFCGDVNLWELVPQPLLGNVLKWLKGP